MWDMIKSGFIMAVYSLIAGALLAFVYIRTAPVIEAQKAAKSGASVMAEVLPDMAGGFEEKGNENFTYWVGYEDAGKREAGGYVFIVQGKGYTKSVPIETMVGVNTDLEIVGVKIINQQETPGLGDKIQEIKPGESDPWFTRQFIGKSTDDNLMVAKDGGEIDAISGATISSRAVTNSIRNGLLALEAALSGGEFVMPDEPEVDEEEPGEKPITMPTDEQIASVLPGMAAYEVQDKDSDFPYWIAYKDAGKKNVGGYLFIARREGFAGMIETLVGVDTEGKIVGLDIIAHEETPDYGGKMEEVREGESSPWFTRQFTGKSAEDDIKLTSNGGTIDAISGATISSEAFTKSINTGLEHLDAKLSGEEFVPEEEPEKEAAAAVEISPEEALEDVIPAMFGGYELKEGDFPYWIAWRDPDKTEIGGYAFVAEGEGFASTIRTLVAVDPDLTVIGVKVLYHEETEGWGSKITEIREGEEEPWFPQQFVGKNASDTIALTGDGGSIDAISEATITSNAVTTSIDTGLKRLKAVLSGETFVPEAAEDEVDAEEETAEEGFARVEPETALRALFPDGSIYELKDAESDLPYWVVYSDPARIETIGYAFVAEGEGFASTIETLVAVNPGGTITGVRLLFHEETEGWGSKITDVREGEKAPWFLQQFVGKSASDTIALTGDGGTIDALSEATITSDGVTQSISAGLKKLMEKVG